MKLNLNKLNLVYDNWDEITNLPYQPNSIELYPNIFHMPYDSVIKGLQIPNEYINRFKLNDILKYPNNNFYYFVTLMPNEILNNFINKKSIVLPEVIEFIKNNKNLNIIFMNWMESENFQTFKFIHNWCLSMDIPQCQIWISNNNPKLNEYKNKLNSDINVYSSKYLPNIGPMNMRSAFGKINFKQIKDGNLFMCHNRRVKPHRYGILCLLKKYEILDDTDWSLVNGWDMENKNIISFYSSVFNMNDIDEMKNEISYFSKIYQKKSKYEESYDWFDSKNDEVDWSKPYKKDTYENSYFNITTETEFSSDLIHITEKSFKPFYAMQFPLILASYNHIQEIKKRYDFDFFDDVIDHTYDDIQNNRDRMFAFANEIKRIYNNKHFFIEFYKNNKERFIKNYEKSLSYGPISLNDDKNFLLNLSNIKQNYEKHLI
jgi:hypothetical protein